MQVIRQESYFVMKMIHKLPKGRWGEITHLLPNGCHLASTAGIGLPGGALARLPRPGRAGRTGLQNRPGASVVSQRSQPFVTEILPFVGEGCMGGRDKAAASQNPRWLQGTANTVIHAQRRGGWMP